MHTHSRCLVLKQTQNIKAFSQVDSNKGRFTYLRRCWRFFQDKGFYRFFMVLSRELYLPGFEVEMILFFFRLKFLKFVISSLKIAIRIYYNRMRHISLCLCCQ